MLMPRPPHPAAPGRDNFSSLPGALAAGLGLGQDRQAPRTPEGAGRWLFVNGLVSRSFSYMLQVSLPVLAVHYAMLGPRLAGLATLALWASGGLAVLLAVYARSRVMMLGSLVAMPAASLLAALGGPFTVASFIASYFLVSMLSAYLAPSSFIAEGMGGVVRYTVGISAGLILGVAFQIAAVSSPNYYLYAPISLCMSLALALTFPRGIVRVGAAQRDAGRALVGVLLPLLRRELRAILSIYVLSSAIWLLLTSYAEVFAMSELGLGTSAAAAGILVASAASLASRASLMRAGMGRAPALYLSVAMSSAGVLALSIARDAAGYFAAAALIGAGHGLQAPLIYAAAFGASEGSEMESYAALNAAMGAGEFLTSSLGTALIAAAGFRLGMDAFLAALLAIAFLAPAALRVTGAARAAPGSFLGLRSRARAWRSRGRRSRPCPGPPPRGPSPHYRSRIRP